MKVGKKSSRRKGNKRRIEGNKRQWLVAIGAAGAVIGYTIGPDRHLHKIYASDLSIRKGVIARLKDAGSSPIDFNIQPGLLGDVLDQLSRKAGIVIRFQSEEIRSLRSNGVIGNYSIESALKIALKDTGTSFVFIDQRTIFISVTADSAQVEVNSEAGPEVVFSPKFPEPLKNTPLTVNVIGAAAIRQQGATTLRDVLANVPGITLTAGEGGAPAGDNLVIRGFSARNDIFIDGSRDLGAQSRDPFNLEQVEVVKGPSSTYTGRGSTGGTVNLVSKVPVPKRVVGLTLSGGTSDFKRALADVNLSFNSSIAMRVNGLAHDSDFPGREAVASRRFGFAPSITFGLGTASRLTAAYFNLTQNNISDYGIPWVPATNNALAAYRDRPAPVRRSTFYGFISRDKERLRSDLFTLRYEREFNDRISLRQQVRYGYSRRDSIATPPRFDSNNSTTVRREMRSWLVYDDVLDSQTDLTFRFSTGKFRHSLVAGGQYSYEKSHRILRTAPISLTTLHNPNPFDVYTGTITVNPLEPKLTADTGALYFLDTIDLFSRLQFVGGLRFDIFDVKGRNVNTSVSPNVFFTLARIDRMLSGRAALVYKPTDEGTIYLSFTSSTNPSLEGLLYTPADVRTPPERTSNVELGAKWVIFRDKLLLTTAVFRIEKFDARTPSLIAGEPPTLDGDQRISGFELGASGNITRNWQFSGGYTFLDSEIVRSNTAPTIVNGISFREFGKRLINTPKNSLTLWTTYRLDKFFFGGGARYSGKRYGNNINTRFVDPFWVADGLVSYRLNRRIDLKLNINNLFDKYYIDRIGGGHIIPGAGRSLAVTTEIHF